tara:strand:+ start:48 stop:323 length:276 start_codon:yes stop_codon:yes gene_type:complete
MKRTRKSAKKPVKQATWGDKLNEAWGWTKDLSSTLWTKLMGTAFDDEFPLGLGLVLTGGAILVGCLDPWTVIGILGVVLGAHKLYHIFKWQ